MKKLSLNTKLGLLLLGIFLIFIFSHLTPTVALRTRLFFTSQPTTAFTSELLETKHTKDTFFYEIKGAPVEKATQTPLDHFEVKKSLGLLYFAEYAGQA